MSSPSTHEPAAEHVAHPAPGLPVVHDEAGDTPVWVPVLGVALFLFFGVWAIYTVASHGDDAAAMTGDGGVTDGDVADGAATSDGGTPTP